MIIVIPRPRHAIAVIFLVFSTLWAQTSASSPNDYKKHMDDVQESKDDLTDAVDNKNSEQAIAISKKLADLLHTDIDYWKTRKIDHAVELANSSYDLAVQIGTHAKAHDFVAAHNSLLQLQNRCRACHDAHPERQQ